MTETQKFDAEAQRLANLRWRAAAQLSGLSSAQGASAQAVNALAVLHELAAVPETAADALTLLHELQVHQVELELQAQELRDSRAELERALHRQGELYEHQPVGCFTVDAHTRVCEANATGAAMLGVGRDEAPGLVLAAFFLGESLRPFKGAMAAVADGAPRSACLLVLRTHGGRERPVLASVAADPAGARYLVCLADTVVA